MQRPLIGQITTPPTLTSPWVVCTVTGEILFHGAMHHYLLNVKLGLLPVHDYPVANRH